MKPSSGGVLNRFLNWLGGHELVVLLTFAGMVSCVWLFAWIAAEMTDGNTQAFDERVLLAMRHPTDRSPLVHRTCRMPPATSRLWEESRYWHW